MKNKKSSILYVFIVFITLSCLFVAAPVLLKFDSFYNVVTKFFEGLRIQEYKNAYVSALGGMLGSGLAVTVQSISKNVQKKNSIQEQFEKAQQ